MLRTALLAGTVLAALGAGTAVPALAQPSDPDGLFWQSLDPTRPDEVQAYLRAFPNGHFKAQAVTALAHDPAAPETASRQLDVAAWQAADKRSPAALQSYLLAFPDGLFAPLARARLAESLAGLPLGQPLQPANSGASPAAPMPGTTTPVPASQAAAPPPGPPVAAPPAALAPAAPMPAATAQAPASQNTPPPGPPAAAPPAAPAQAAPMPAATAQAPASQAATPPGPPAAGPPAAAPPAAPVPAVAPVVAPTPAPQNAAPAEPAAAPATPPVMEVVRTAILRAAPSVRSRALHDFAPGERLTVGPIVPDKHWYRLDSGKWHGYVAASVLKPVAVPVPTVVPPPVPGDKPKAEAAPAASGTADGTAAGSGVIAGPVQVIDTGDLMVAGHKLALFGIQGLGAPYDAGMAAFLAKQGGIATCRAKGEGRYVCVTAAGVDLAEAALVNGAAKAAPDAPADYQDQQKDAKTNRRGIWSQ